MDKKRHKWILNDYDQSVYLFAAEGLGGEYHNGPKCKTCGFEFCHHCFPKGYSTPCGSKSLGSDDKKLSGAMVALDRSLKAKYLKQNG